MKKIVCVLLLIVAFSGCSSPHVRARSFYTSRQDLASYVIDTPDPNKSTMLPGQILFVSWSAPSQEGLFLDVIVRYKGGEETHKKYPLKSSMGEKSIRISPDKEGKKRELLSYYITLNQGEHVLAKTKHKLWVEKVEIKDLPFEEKPLSGQ